MIDYDELNFQNLITFFGPELRKIRRGKYALDVLSGKEVRKLKEFNILVKSQKFAVYSYSVTPEASKFLDKTSKELFPKEDSN